ncbi:MAG: hypothetical protein OXC54_07975, partial [Rhodospirillaceae bacterium]|nr:hypothetical protein [Rhodospirillaceae bacterium]
MRPLNRAHRPRAGRACIIGRLIGRANQKPKTSTSMQGCHVPYFPQGLFLVSFDVFCGEIAADDGG